MTPTLDVPRGRLLMIAHNVLCKHLRERYEWEGTTLAAAITGVSASSLVAAKEEWRLRLGAMMRILSIDQDLLEVYRGKT